MREAMNLAIDRKALADSLFGGYAKPTKGQLVNPRPSASTRRLSPIPMIRRRPRR